MILLNGERADIGAGATIADALARLGIHPAPRTPGERARGIAVAVDGEVVPRAEWETYALGADARVEVLTAMQGG